MMGSVSARLYFNRYTEDAVDLCDVLSSYNPAKKDNAARIVPSDGAAAKARRHDRGEVEKFYRDGRIRDIAEYCETNVVNTYRVWLRYELFRGRLTEAEYQASELGLVEFVAARVAVRSRSLDLS